MRFYILVSILFSTIAQANPEFFAKIRALRIEGKTQKAMELVESALVRPTLDSKEFPLLMMEKGLLLQELGRPDESVDLYQNVLKVETNIAEYAHLELSKVYSIQKKTDLQRSELKEVLSLSPNSKMQKDIQYELVKLDIEEKKYKQARPILMQLEKRSRREEPYPEIIYQLSRVEKGMGQSTQFCKWIRKLYAHYPDYKPISDWGYVLQNNNFDGVPTKCQTSFEEKKSRIKNLQWSGLSQKAFQEIQLLKNGDEESKREASRLEIAYYLHEGDAEKAIEMLKPQFETQKNDPNFLMLVAQAASKLGDLPSAVGAFYGVYKKAPRGKFGKQALYQAAFASYQSQDYDGAARKFQEFMKIFPGSGLSRDAKWHLAWIRYLRGDFQEAYKALVSLKKEAHRSKKIARNFAFDRVNFWLAMSLYRLGNYSEARELFESLSKDKLFGFYAIASQARLKKIEILYPKISQRILPDENLNVVRINNQSVLMPSDDPQWFQEVHKQQIDSKLTQEMASEDVKISEQESKTSSENAETEQELLSTHDNRDTGEDKDAQNTSTAQEEITANFSNPVLIRRFERARDLMTIGEQDWARWELFDIEKRTNNKEHLRTLMQEYEVIGSYNRSSYIGHVTFGNQRAAYGIEMGRNLWEHAYPKAYSGYVNKFSRDFNVPNELIWGIMRAESQYKKDVISPVGALGLMQIMPFTATKVAEILGEKKFESKKLLQPENAIKIGSKYLQRLLKKFNGNYALVAAGYNAGPHRVLNWVSSFGQLDLDEFVEHIPYLETRNYVKKVLSNFVTYSKLYGDKKDVFSSLCEPIRTVAGSQSGPFNSKENWEEL